MSRITQPLFIGLLLSSSALIASCSDAEQTTSTKSEPNQVEAIQSAATPDLSKAAKPEKTEKTSKPSESTSDTNSESSTSQPTPKTKQGTPSSSSESLPAIPKFKDFAAGPPRKQAFFKFMAPLIKRANASILEDRNRLKTLIQSNSMTQNDQAWLKQQADHYGLDSFNPANSADKNALLTRMDVIPPALALAQGANESAWGTSRFARQANNYFGQWCFSKGCGLVPKQRNAGATHEVRAFDHPYQSIVSYLHNLNSHRTYEKLRQIRAQTRQKGKMPTGLEMAEGLVNYSERKHEYVKELQSMIRYNKLTQYN